MTVPSEIYRPSLSLLTDLYQVTMAYGYWKTGMDDHEAVFSLHFRQHPFGGGYTIAAGLEYAIDYVQSYGFASEEIDYLASLEGNDGKPLFETGFLDYLAGLELSCDIDAIPEGTPVFPHQPLLRVRGPIIEGQLLETPLLNLINFQTLIATKATRISSVTGGEPLVEFGLRRAQGIDGALSASRAAYLGGCDATSNVLAGRLFGIPVRGTLAHSWVMFFESERQAFLEYARVMPNNCVFLVDTYNTLGGVERAIEAGKWLRDNGHEMIGIRLDSGDLAYLSIEARKMLDAAGFPTASIFASNELDEKIIGSLKGQGAAINAWGVGTRLVTGHDCPALGGVYKLAAIRHPDREWEYKLKLSEQAAKVGLPGILQVRRFRSDGEPVGDLIFDEATVVGDGPTLIDPHDRTRTKTIPAGAEYEDLLVPVFRRGELCYSPPTLEAIRERRQRELGRFHPGIRRFTNPHSYPVGLEESLHELRTRLIVEARQMSS